MEEMPIKMNDTKKFNSNQQFQFYMENKFKNERHKKIKL